LSYRSAFKRVVSVCFILSLAFVFGISPSVWDRPAALAAPAPDLVIPDISLSPPQPAIGNTVTITVTVKNQGTAQAYGSQAVCYVDDVILGTNSISTLNAGAMATTSFVWKATAGSHIIRAIADSGGAIPESDESNNTMSLPVTTLTPDLIVLSVSWTPSGPSKGDSVSFRINVKNQGNSRSGASRVNFYIDGNSRGYKDIYPIEPGNTSYVTYNWVAQAGQHSLKAVIDEGNQVEESIESNNEYTATFSTLPPDLTVKSISWDPADPSKGDTVTFIAVVVNQGTGRSDPCQLAYYFDGQYQSSELVPSLEAGSSANVTFDWLDSSEIHEVKVVVDSAKTVVESDENNNNYTSGFLTLLPDLTVTDITWDPENPGVGDTVTFTVTVKNQGTGRSVSSRLACYVSGSFSDYVDIGQIEAGKEAHGVFTWKALGGTFIVKAVADGENLIIETDEDNNTINRTIVIVPPDISIPVITWTPVNPPIGDIVTFTANITNLGGGAAGGFYIAYYIDDELLSFDFISGILTGDTISRTCDWKAQNGRHIFKAVADYNFKVSEGNENNNENAVTVTPLMPDIAVGNIIWSPPDLSAGVKTTFSVAIQNRGTLVAGPSRAAYYVDGVIAGYDDIESLEAGVTVTRYFTWTVADGPHAITVTVDSADRVFELDEDNNTKVVTVPLPDLSVTGIAWSPPQASIGDEVTFTATVVNQGAGASRGTLSACYVDGVALASDVLDGIDAGGSGTVSFVWTAVAGEHRILIMPDADNAITEADETNNDKETVFSTLTPDLVVADIEWHMENPLVSDAAEINMTIANQGTDVTGDFRLLYSIDGNPAVNVDMAPIPAGGSFVLSVAPHLEIGPHTVSVTIDTAGEVAELDETNNTKSINFSTVAPDLVIRSISWPPKAAAGDNVTITVNVVNQGTDKAAKSRVALYVNGELLSYAELDELAVGASVNPEFSWSAVAGPQEISARVDTDGVLTESNEVNNTRSRAISLSEPLPTPTKKAVVDLSTGSSEGRGFIGDFWWLFLLGAMLLGVGAFLLALKSFKKE
jgi:subtilase family serine protease